MRRLKNVKASQVSVLEINLRSKVFVFIFGLMTSVFDGQLTLRAFCPIFDLTTFHGDFFKDQLMLFSRSANAMSRFI